MPWLSKNSAMKLAGKLHICSGSADQTAEAWGTISRSTKWREKPLSSSQCAERGGGAVHPDQRLRLAVEAAPVAQHAEEGGAEQVGGAGEEAARRARVLEAAAPVGDREAHVRGLAGDPELVQQPFEVGVVAVVEDDEAGVDPVGLVLAVDLGPCCEWPPTAVARLVDDELVLAVQPVGGDEPRDAGSDDRDLHRCQYESRERWMNSPNSGCDGAPDVVQFRYDNGMAVSLPAARCAATVFPVDVKTSSTAAPGFRAQCSSRSPLSAMALLAYMPAPACACRLNRDASDLRGRVPLREPAPGGGACGHSHDLLLLAAPGRGRR